MKNKITEKIRIRLESFNYKLLISSCYQIMNLIKVYNPDKLSLVPLPTKKRIYCVLRSPHVDKKSREHFEIRTHKRILDVSYNPKVNILELLLKLELPSGILYQIYLI